MLVAVLEEINADCGAPSVGKGEAVGTRRTQGVRFDSSLGECFEKTARQRSDQPVLVADGYSISYASLLQAASNVAANLQRMPEFASSRNVALLTGNSAAYLAGFYGTLLAGGVVVPLPESIESSRLSAMLHTTSAKIVLTSPTQIARRGDLTSKAMNRIGLSGRGGEVVCSQAKANDLAVIMFTSGTTTEPKGVMLSHRNLLANAESILEVLPISQDDRTLALLPFCHAYGNSVLQTHVLAGATLVIDGSPLFPNTIVDALEGHQIASLAGVPEVFHSLLACSDLGERNLPSLRYMTVAGGAIDSGKALEVAASIAPAEFYVMYGQTEATARLTCLKAGELFRRPGSVGKAVPGVEVAVRDEHGHPVSRGEVGELCARGANIMLGYWADQESESRKLRNGWLRTGDLATVDNEGFLYLKGRHDEQIKVRGLTVSPREIERTLSHPLSGSQVAVVPFRFQGTHRLALFVAGDEELIGVDRIWSCCKKALGQHELPSYVEILTKLPQTAALKTDRQQLARHATKQLNKQTVNPQLKSPIFRSTPLELEPIRKPSEERGTGTFCSEDSAK